MDEGLVVAEKTKGAQKERHRKILEEARTRFRRCSDWEATARTRFRDDVKFAEADAYNQWQWPTNVLADRQKRVNLTINRVRQHNLDILNDARQARIAIKVRPLRGGASFESAQMFDGLIRHIEYISNAASAYQLALKFAVQGGIGWFRLVTDYVGDDTFDQDIFIRQIKDPLTVYLDPDISEFDGSDARYGFVFTDMPKDEFDKAYPQYKDIAADNEIAPDQSWMLGERVRVAEYFRCVQDESKLYAFVDPTTGEQVVKTEKEVDKALLDLIIDAPDTAMRSVMLTKVEYFKIVGDNIAEEKEWLGRYIPLIRVVGEETVIDGLLDRKGHTRALLDSQRMLNYNFSASVEFGALQSKVPYVAPARAIENYEEYWNNANTANYSVLPWNHTDEDGNPVPPPQRQQPPTGAPVFMQGARDALEQMYLVSGQNQADFGQPGNEKSGVAIQQRQRQGDNATYHYLDHQAIAVRFCGKQLLDLIPKVYDTDRMVQYRDEAGNETELRIDPNAPEAYSKEEDEQGNEFAVLNPRLGAYDVQADVGPAYATRRQEAFEAFSQLLSSNKELISVVGDIWMRFADIPGAEEAAQRLKRLVPQAALKDGPSPDMVAAQQQIEQLQNFAMGLAQKLADKEADWQNDQQKLAIEGYKAQSGRLTAIKEALALDPKGLLRLVMLALDEAADTSRSIEDVGEAAYIAPPAPEEIAPAMGGQMPPPMVPEAQDEPV